MVILITSLAGQFFVFNWSSTDSILKNQEEGINIDFIWISSKTKNNTLANLEEDNISLNKLTLVYKKQSSIVAENLSSEEKKKLEEVVKKVVLPAKSTFKYVVKKGDTIEKIAKKFGVKIQDLIAVNNLKNKNLLIAGEEILIPSQNIKITAKLPSSKFYKVIPEFVNALSELGNILVPVSGINQKRIHSNNGVDISAECGTPVYAAESGVVIESADGWNGGYGNYIVIKHEYFETLYSHLAQRYVEVGDYVEKGSLIGIVGATGKATGCHLHFETRGIKNPLAK